MDTTQQALSDFVSARHNGGLAVSLTESLMYSGMVDSLGIQELASFMSKLAGRAIAATEIVEQDLDTVELLAAFVVSKGAA